MSYNLGPRKDEWWLNCAIPYKKTWFKTNTYLRHDLRQICNLHVHATCKLLQCMSLFTWELGGWGTQNKIRQTIVRPVDFGVEKDTGEFKWYESKQSV